jgi:hypothetical protein
MPENWRDYGDVPAAFWRATISGHDGPAELASEAAWQAARPHSRLGLAMLGEESSWGTRFKRNTPSNHNALNLRPPDGNGYVTFATWTAGVAGWNARVTDPTYKNGIYAKTVTLADLIHVYAPNSDHNDEAAYISHVAQRIASYPVEDPKMSRGHVPEPPMQAHYQARINAVDKKNCTDGINRLPIVGTDSHTEVGRYLGTAQWFDNPNNGALADFQIGGPWDGQYDGVIMRFIEPDMPVAPYANGTIGKARPPFGDGLRFVQTFGYGEAINARLRSIERSDNGQPNRMDYDLHGRQTESWCFLVAYVHSEEAGQSWEEFDWFLYHSESGTDHVDCPGAWAWANVDAIRVRVVEIMKAYQTDTPLSRPLLITYPPGWAGGTIHQPGHGQGKPVEVPKPAPKPQPEPWVFDPKLVWPNVGDGAVSKAYLAYGSDTGLWQRPSQPWNDKMPDGSKLFRFDGGLTIRLKGNKATVVKGK